MRKLYATVFVLMLAACATTRERPLNDVEGATEKCTRFTAAVRVYSDGLSPMKMQKRAIEECRLGDGMACVAAPVAIPFTALLAVVGAPVLIPIFMTNDNVYRTGCRSPQTTVPAETWSGAPQSETDMPDQSPDPGERR